jgi:hypothetical protein
MKRLKVFTAAFTLIVVIGTMAAWAATIDVTQFTYATGNNEYDRNPSIVYDGSQYWLFYTKGDDISTNGVRGLSYNPDSDTYVVYYKTASTIGGLASAGETKLALSETSRPANFDQRVVSATYFNNKIYAFVSSGQSSLIRGLYYYVYDGISWSGPTTLIADATARGGHVNVTNDGGHVYIVWESTDGSSDCYTWDGVNLSSKIDISNDNMPKITLMGSTLYVVSIEDGTGDIEVYSAAAGASPSFTWHSTAITGAGLYDPCIFNDGSNLYVVTAPYDGGSDKQWLIQAKYTGAWATEKRVSFGGYGGTNWWEYWPIGFFDGADLWLFFTTETSGTSYSDAEIGFMKMDWNLANDHYCYVQNAVDQSVSGDVIDIASGNYIEQVEITKDVTISGAGSTTVIQSPNTLTKKFTTSADNFPIVYIHDAGNVTVQNLTVDGAGKGNANYRFIGIGFRNAGGTVSGCAILDVRDTPFSGAQHGVALYAYNDDAVSRTLSVLGNTFSGFQKNAIALNASATTPLAVDVQNNVITGYGPTDITAQNGVQVWADQGTGTVANNTVTGIAYDNTYASTKWVATSILNYYADLDINNNTVSNGHVGVYNYDGAGLINNNNLTIEKIGVYAWGIIATDPSGVKASPFDAPASPSKVSGRLGSSTGATALLSVEASGNTITFSGTDNSATYGIEADAGWGPDDLTFTANNNTIDGFDIGFEYYQCQSSCDVGVFTSISANNNLITDCTSYGMESNAAYITVNAENNWWGDATGPYHPLSNPFGQGAPVSDYIDFTPWLAPEISVVPGYAITNCSTSTSFTIQYTATGIPEQVRGFDVTFSIDTTVATISNPATDITEGSLLSSAGTTQFFVVDNGGGSYSVSCAILGGSSGATGSGDLFSIALTPVGEGTSAIAITDKCGIPITSR